MIQCLFSNMIYVYIIYLNDVYLSLPAVLNNEGIRDVLKLELSNEEQEKLRYSAQTLKNVLKAVGLN